MDTLPRENNSYLPIGALIVGALAIVLSIVALAKVSSAKNEIRDQLESLGAKIDRLDEVENVTRNAASSATSAVERANTAVSHITALQRSTQDALTHVGQELGNIRGEVAELRETRVVSKTPAAGGTKSTGPVVAGPDEYVVKSGDTGYKIASANGVSVADLQAVNPGVSWTALKVGQKIKLPAKK